MDPIWENFSYKVDLIDFYSKKQLEVTHVVIEIWDHDMIGSHDFMGNLIIPLQDLRYGNKKTLNLSIPDGYTDNVLGKISFEYEIEYTDTITFAKLDEIDQIHANPGPIVNWLIKEKENGFYTDLKKFDVCKFCLAKLGWKDLNALDYLYSNDYFPPLSTVENNETLLSYLVQNYQASYFNPSIAWLLMHKESPLKELPNQSNQCILDLPGVFEIPAIQKWKELNKRAYENYENNNSKNFNFDEDKEQLKKINSLCIENKFSEVWNIYLSKIDDSAKISKLSRPLYYLNYLISLYENIPDDIQLPSCGISKPRTIVASINENTYNQYIDIFNELIQQEDNDVAKSRFEFQKLILQILVKNDIVDVCNHFDGFIKQHNKLSVAFGFAANFYVDPHLSEFIYVAHNYRIGSEIFDDYLLIPLRNDLEKAYEIALKGAELGSGWCEYILGIYEKEVRSFKNNYQEHFTKAVELGFPEAKIHMFYHHLRNLGDSSDVTPIQNVFDEVINAKNQTEKTKYRAKFLKGFYKKRQITYDSLDFVLIRDAATHGVHMASDFIAFKDYKNNTDAIQAGGSGSLQYLRNFVAPISTYGNAGGMIVFGLSLMIDAANVAYNVDQICRWYSRADFLLSKLPSNVKTYYFMFDTALDSIRFSGNPLLKISESLVDALALEKQPTTFGIAYGNGYPFKQVYVNGNFLPPDCNLKERDPLGVPVFYTNYYNFDGNEKYLIQHWN